MNGWQRPAGKGYWMFGRGLRISFPVCKKKKKRKQTIKQICQVQIVKYQKKKGTHNMHVMLCLNKTTSLLS